MASEQPAEGEQEYEAGEPNQELGGYYDEEDTDEERGFGSDDSGLDFTGGGDEDSDPPDPFSEFEQFERYETSDELINDLGKAGEDERKAMEDKIYGIHHE